MKGYRPEVSLACAQGFKGLPDNLRAAPAAAAIFAECIDLAVFLIEKNLAYGNSALEPLNALSKLSPEELIKVRMDDKLSRMVRGSAAGEDPPRDFSGYYILLRIAERHTAQKDDPT